MKIAQIQQRVTSAINQDPYKDRIKSVSLFGSFLHGDARPDSDIDLLFEMDQTKTFSLFKLIELQDRLSQKLGRKVDLIEKDSLDKYIKDNVLAEAKTIYGASIIKDVDDFIPPQGKINRDRLHLLHIQDAISKIEDYVKNINYTDFAKRDIIFDAIMMQMVVIGEAVHSLSEGFKESHYGMPWHQAIGLRNKTAHGYFDINPKIVWDILQNDLPELKKQVEKLIT